jgi:hypothetical protein
MQAGISLEHGPEIEEVPFWMATSTGLVVLQRYSGVLVAYIAVIKS